MALQEYKCPCCGGGIEFNSEIQKMKCPYCDTEFEMDTLRSFDEELKNDAPDEMKWETTAGSMWSEEESSKMRAYSCKSCGGEIIGEDTTGAMACPYCGNPVVMMEQFSGTLKPDYIIPFKLDKQAAMDRYNKHLSGKKLLPKVFKEHSHIEEIKGVYVPFWLFDAKSNARMRYKATKISSWSDSKYNYTRTDYFNVIRGGDVEFEHVPVDGSSKMDDTLMEALEPFDFKDAVSFQTAYLAGYVADKYDVDADASINRANTRVKTSTEIAFRNTVTGYSSVNTEYSTVRLSNGKAQYALYPVWLMNTNWNGNQYVFAMNGQTGKFVGDLPCDKSLASKAFFKACGIATAVVFAIQALIWFL